MKFLNKLKLGLVSILLSLSCLVSCKVNLERIVMVKSSYTCKLGGTVSLVYVCEPLGNDYTLVFTSDNESVATVDQEGVVTGVSVGVCDITISNKDKSIYSTCSVMVYIDAYSVNFAEIEGSEGLESFTVYTDQSMSKVDTDVETYGSYYSRNGDTGEYTTEDGQVNFSLVLKDGYKVNNINIAGEYKNCKGPSDTEVENFYRITKIASELTVYIVIVEDTSEDEGYKVTLTGDGGVKKIEIYLNKKCEGDPIEGEIATSLDETTFEPTKEDGQVYFKVYFNDGYEFDYGEVVDNPDVEAYKNLKTPDDTKIENGYRLTKIKRDFTLRIVSKTI